MPNFRMLRDSGTNFNDAYLGYMGSETVISHNVFMSGQNPKHMGWVDEAYRDREGLLSSGTDQMWTTGELTPRPVRHADPGQGLPEAGGLPASGPAGQEVHRGRREVVRGRVRGRVRLRHRRRHCRAVQRQSSSTPSPADAACNATLGGRYRGPGGVNVPTYIKPTRSAGASTSTRLVQRYGTDATPSRRGSTRSTATGSSRATTPAHLGGDTWVADAAMAMMENEDWSGMFVTMGGIDKAGHMWGADSDVQSAPGLARLPVPRPVRRRERRRAARPDARQARGSSGRARRHARRADRRPRRDVRHALLREDRGRSARRHQLVLRDSDVEADGRLQQSRRLRSSRSIATGNVAVLVPVDRRSRRG